LILSVETATLSGSIALSRGEQILAVFAGDPGSSHSNTLLKDIDKLLNDVMVQLSEIDLFAVASGPGSFTGLRIGIATVKGLAATLERPCCGVPTLQAVALSGGVSQRSVALLPAGRGEVFAQMFSVASNGVVTELDNATHISPQRLLEKYRSVENVVWCGQGAVANKEMIDEVPGWRIAAPDPNLARYVATIALAKFRNAQLEQPDSLQAVYVRPSDAELKV
jgi:tRNA threonylcarbamoyladenosine biosynthesis protein TsaB